MIAHNYKIKSCISWIIGILLISIATTSRAQIGQGQYVTAPSWSPDGSRIAIVRDNQVEIGDATAGLTSLVLTGHTDFIPMVVWSPDSSMVATPSYDQSVKIWRASDGQLLYNLEGHNDAVTAVMWSPDSERVLSFGLESNPSLFVWDALTGKLLSNQESGTIVVAAFSPDGQKLTLLTSLSLSIRDGNTLEPIAQSPRVQCCSNQMRSIAWSPDSSMLATGSLNGLVTLWDASTAQILRQFEANSHTALDSRDISNVALSWVRDVAFTADGTTVMAISGDGMLREWNTATGELTQEIQLAPLYSASWSPYGGQLAILGPTVSEIALSSENAFDASLVSGELDTIVPFPSIERFNSIAQGCISSEGQRNVTFTSDVEQLPAFIEQLDLLPDEQIPEGCRADLLAIAEAIQAE